MPERRRTFGPVVLVGLAAAALAAVAGNKPLVRPAVPPDLEGRAALVRPEVTSLQESPLAAALALVVLACWGVLLVTRGRLRRGVSWLALVAAGALLVTVVSASWTLAGPLAEELRAQTGSDAVGTAVTGWSWVAIVAAALVLATTALAAWLVPHWPEMGSRYDAPTGGDTARVRGADDGPADNLDIWKALDEGRDPTA